MASRADVDTLTRDHMADQIRIARSAQLESVSLWQLLRYESLDASTRAWLAAQAKITLDGRRLSAVRASEYYNALRVADIGAPVTPSNGLVKVGTVLVPAEDIRPPQATVARVMESARVTGPIRVWKSISLGRTPTVAMNDGAASVAASVQRQVLNGGRSSMMRLMGLEPRVTYYERVTSGGDTCQFCKMLASRGPVYTADSGSFQAHDGCGCSLRPRFSGGARSRKRGYSRYTEFDGYAPVSPLD